MKINNKQNLAEVGPKFSKSIVYLNVLLVRQKLSKENQFESTNLIHYKKRRLPATLELLSAPDDIIKTALLQLQRNESLIGGLVSLKELML